MNLRQQLKLNARTFISHAKPSPFLVGLVAVALLQVLELMDQYVTNYAERYNAMMEAYESYMTGGNMDALLNAAQSTELTVTQGLLSGLLQLVGLMLGVGIIIYTICAIRYHKGSYGNLFDGLPVMLRVLWYQILSGLYIFLWSLLFVIPGLVASYNYRMGLYLLLDHPELSVSQCLKASKQMMRGNRMELLFLDLSFLGWNLGLYVISAGVGVSGLGIAGLIMMLPMTAFVTIYMQFTDFLFYEHLLGVHYEPLPAPEKTEQ